MIEYFELVLFIYWIEIFGVFFWERSSEAVVSVFVFIVVGRLGGGR